MSITPAFSSLPTEIQQDLFSRTQVLDPDLNQKNVVKIDHAGDVENSSSFLIEFKLPGGNRTVQVGTSMSAMYL